MSLKSLQSVTANQKKVSKHCQQYAHALLRIILTFALPSVHETVAFIRTKYFPVTLKVMATVALCFTDSLAL